MCLPIKSHRQFYVVSWCCISQIMGVCPIRIHFRIIISKLRGVRLYWKPCIFVSATWIVVLCRDYPCERPCRYHSTFVDKKLKAVTVIILVSLHPMRFMGTTCVRGATFLVSAPCGLQVCTVCLRNHTFTSQMYTSLECGTWYHHPWRLQCVLSRNLRIFKVATWQYRCRHNLKNNCIWDNLQCCLLVPMSPSKPVMLTFDLQSRKVLFIEIVFWHV